MVKKSKYKVFNLEKSSNKPKTSNGTKKFCFLLFVENNALNRNSLFKQKSNFQISKSDFSNLPNNS